MEIEIQYVACIKFAEIVTITKDMSDIFNYFFFKWTKHI